MLFLGGVPRNKNWGQIEVWVCWFIFLLLSHAEWFYIRTEFAQIFFQELFRLESMSAFHALHICFRHLNTYSYYIWTVFSFTRN